MIFAGTEPDIGGPPRNTRRSDSKSHIRTDTLLYGSPSGPRGSGRIRLINRSFSETARWTTSNATIMSRTDLVFASRESADHFSQRCPRIPRQLSRGFPRVDDGGSHLLDPRRMCLDRRHPSAAINRVATARLCGSVCSGFVARLGIGEGNQGKNRALDTSADGITIQQVAANGTSQPAPRQGLLSSPLRRSTLVASCC
jgi:hypothetical protein